MLGLLLVVLVAGGACSRDTASSAATESTPKVDIAPDGWNEVRMKAIELFQQRQYAESTAVLEQFVQAHPNYSQGHHHLGENHQLLGSMESTGIPPAARREHLETAVRHFTRARELSVDPLDREVATDMLVLTLADDGLNRLDEALRYARENADEQPTAPNYARVASVLRSLGKAQDGADVLMAARDRLAAYEREYKLANAMVDHVEESPDLARETAAGLLNAALASAERLQAPDAELTSESFLPASQLRGAGMLLKADILRVQAERFVQSAAEKSKLLAEADRLHKEGMALVD